MSNPAVIKLIKKKLGTSRVWLDDNFGEAIHIHIDNHRIDLTVEEFEQLYKDLCIAMNELYPIEGLDFNTIDPVFIERWLWPILPTINGTRIDKVYLEDLWAPNHGVWKLLKDSIGVRALKGISSENEGYRKSHHIGQTDNQRLEECLNSIKEKGYPYKNQYIILKGDNNIIYDGQHRASCLYYLYGNIEIPVIRLYSSSFKKEEIKKERLYQKWIIFRWYNKIKSMLKKMGKRMSKFCNYFIEMLLKKYRRYNKRKTHSLDENVLNLFQAK